MAAMKNEIFWMILNDPEALDNAILPLEDGLGISVWRGSGHLIISFMNVGRYLAGITISKRNYKTYRMDYAGAVSKEQFFEYISSRQPWLDFYLFHLTGVL